MKIVLLKKASFVFCIAITAFTLSKYAVLIQPLLSIEYNWTFELLMVIGMLIFQYPFIYKMKWNIKIDYYFNMLLISLLGSILLWPLLFANHFTNIKDMVNVGYFFIVVATMFFIHKKMVTKMQLPLYISYTYILYRFIILLFIIKL